MNHRRFKFYKHSTEYYRQLHNSITELEELDLTPDLQQYKSTINCNRKSKFIKTNNNTNKYHKKIGWVSWDSQSFSQSVSCVLLESYGIAEISC